MSKSDKPSFDPMGAIYYPDDDHPSGLCKVCNKPIKIAIFKGGLWCSDKHRKIYQGEKKAGLR